MFAALALLHKHSLIHADVKPENLLLADNDASRCKVKLGDFGNMMRASSEDTQAYLDTFQARHFSPPLPPPPFGHMPD